MKKLIAATVLALIAADTASANGGLLPSTPPQQGHGGFFSRLLGKQPLPAFQAAPWYLYYPYNAHFQTPAPIAGAFTPPPTAGYGVNPYFPAYGYGK